MLGAPTGPAGETMLAEPATQAEATAPADLETQAEETAPAEPEAPPRPGTAAELVVVISGVPRYHRPDCMLIRFLADADIKSVTRESAEASGCEPCRACRP